MGSKDFKEEEVGTPTQKNSTAIPDASKYYDPLLAGAVVNATQKTEEAKRADAEAEQMLERYQKLIEDGHSGMSALFKRKEPKYDTDKEERLRKAAIVQSFGDMAVAMARGVTAFNKRTGAGYVPSDDLNSPLASIKEINKMRELYAKQRADWEEAMLGNEMAAIKAREEAAKSLATAAQTRATNARKAADDARDDTATIDRARADAEFRAALKAYEIANKPIKETTKASQEVKKEEDLYVFLYDGLYGDDIEESTTTRPVDIQHPYTGEILQTKDVTTTHRKKKRNKPIREKVAIGRYDAWIQLAIQYMKEEGLSEQAALDKVKKEMADEQSNE